jgi:hypothetical protein
MRCFVCLFVCLFVCWCFALLVSLFDVLEDLFSLLGLTRSGTFLSLMPSHRRKRKSLSCGLRIGKSDKNLDVSFYFIFICNFLFSWFIPMMISFPHPLVSRSLPRWTVTSTTRSCPSIAPNFPIKDSRCLSCSSYRLTKRYDGRGLFFLLVLVSLYCTLFLLYYCMKWFDCVDLICFLFLFFYFYYFFYSSFAIVPNLFSGLTM